MSSLAVHAALTALAVGLAGLAVALTTATYAGLALHRSTSPEVALATAVLLAAGPPLAIALSGQGPALRFAVSGLAWSTALLLILPVYFPGERVEALVTALALGEGAEPADPLADPGPPPAREPVAQALATSVAVPRPAHAAEQIALHYEGEGRRMTVDITVEHGGRAHELVMLLDTGATFTTLSAAHLERIGLAATAGSPTITLQTAGGEREANLLLLDRLWLGDLPMDGVAIATCEACASEGVAGLLGLNVTGGFNLSIDADHQEVVFTRRGDYSRHLDIKPFVEIGATIQQVGDRVRARPWLENRSARDLRDATISLRCGERAWTVPLGPIAAGQRGNAERRLPAHDACERYQVGLHAADW